MQFGRVRHAYRKLRKWLKGSTRIEMDGFYCLKTRPVLYEGQSPESFQKAIDDLQMMLVDREFMTIDQKSGVFDEATRIAVEKFQEQTRLRVDGIVGALTWATLLHPVLRYAKTSSPENQDAVRELQKILHSENFNITVDGVFGRETKRAVKQFQQRYGLCPDGVCGPMTWTVLLGQRPELEVKTLWQQLWLRLPTVIEQLTIVAAVQVGIHFSPLGEQSNLSLLHTFVTAYGLTCVASPFLETVYANYLEVARFPLLRFSPYVLVGFLSHQVLGWILQKVTHLTS